MDKGTLLRHKKKVDNLLMSYFDLIPTLSTLSALHPLIISTSSRSPHFPSLSYLHSHLISTLSYQLADHLYPISLLISSRPHLYPLTSHPISISISSYPHLYPIYIPISIPISSHPHLISTPSNLIPTYIRSPSPSLILF